MTWFSSCTTVEEIKTTFRKLARQHHPDLGGDTATMQAINNAYEQALKGCNGQTSVGSDGESHTYKYNETVEHDLMETILKLIALDMVDVEVVLIGVWVWIIPSATNPQATKPYKDQLKELKCRWHSQKKCWYYRSPLQGYIFSSGKDISELAGIYGAVNCSVFKQDPNKKPAKKSRKYLKR